MLEEIVTFLLNQAVFTTSFFHWSMLYANRALLIIKSSHANVLMVEVKHWLCASPGVEVIFPLGTDCRNFSTRIFHELLSRDHVDGRAIWQLQGVGSEAYLNGTSQGPTAEDARKEGHIRGHSK